jgi:hypothetical protein
MDMDVRKKIIAGVVAAAAVGVGSFFIVGAASAAHSITASKDNPVYWLCQNKSTGAQTGIRTYDGSNAYPACGSNYNKLWWSQRGPAGTNGTNGSNAQVSVSAVVNLVDRKDSGKHGDWAVDQLTRTITLTRDHEAPASKCGGGVPECYAYFGSIVDTGSFATITGANSPEAGDPINGGLNGTVQGSSQVEFYASSSTPDITQLPAQETGNDVATGDMVKQLFGSGVQFSAVSQPVWGYTYQVTSGTCERWTNASSGDTGDIVGLNHCTA